MDMQNAANSECQLVEAQTLPSGPEQRTGITRRSFMYLAGMGLASAVFEGSATTALAASSTPKTRIVGILAGDGMSHFTSHFIFDEEYFQKSSFEYVPQIATYACSLAVASFAMGNAVDSYKNKGCIPYRYVQQLMERTGCTDIEHNDDFAGPTARHTIGLIAGRRSIKVDGQPGTLILMGIRGASYFREWAGNMVAGESGDHEGFTIAATKAVAFLKDYVASKKITGKTKVLVAGFSRAGATTNTTGGLLVREAAKNDCPYTQSNGYDMSSLFQSEGFELLQKNLYVYAFEAPAARHAGDELDEKIDKLGAFNNMHSVINPCDYVPLVMPKLWDFKRFGVDYNLPSPTSTTYTLCRDRMYFDLQVNVKFGAKYPVDTFEYPPMDAFMNELLNQVALDLVKSRQHYYEKYQELGAATMEYLFSDRYANGKNGMSMGKFVLNCLWGILKSAFEMSSNIIVAIWDTLCGIVKAITVLVEGKVTVTLIAKFKSALISAGLSWGDEEENIYQMLLAVGDDIGDFLKKNPMLSYRAYKAFSSDNENTQVHSGEVCLAWMQSLDREFMTEFDIGQPLPTSSLGSGSDADEDYELEALDGSASEYRMYMFSDVKDVYFLAEREEPLFKDGLPVVNNSVDGLWYGLDSDSQMCVIAPVSEPMFKVVVEPEVDFILTMARFGANGTEPSHVMTLECVGLDDSEYEVKFNEASIEATGENCGGSIYDSSFDMDDEDSDAQAFYQIDAMSANEAQGLVFGGGANMVGSCAALVAQSADGYEFDYWTVNGRNIIEEPEYGTIEGVEDRSMVVYTHYVTDDAEVIAHFKAIEKPAALSGAITVKASGKRKAKVSWGALPEGAEGVQLRYAAVKSMKNAKKLKVAGTGAGSKTVGKLKSGKRYYFQARTCKKGVDGKYYYSAWSKVKSVKVR